MNIVYNGENDARLGKAVMGETIISILENDPKVVYLDSDLMSCIGTVKYAAAHPDRAIECGISEANMIGVGCGMAAEGYKPICHSFGIFASRRCFDQLFLSAGYAKNDITVLGTDPGVTAAMNGGTHMPFEDVALYRTIPTATVLEPADPNSFISLMKQCPDREGVKYIRFGRKNYAKIYEDGTELEIGKAVVLREGTDCAIVACGIMVNEALKAAATLAEEGISCAVIDSYTIKPLDAETVLAYAKKCGAMVVAENANRHGGLYSAVLEVVAENAPIPCGCVAVEDEYGEVGPQSYLQERFGLTAAHIVEQVKNTIARK